jgi:hypothetical protein
MVNLESTILLTAVAEGTEFGTLPHSFETSLITLPIFSDSTFKFVRFMTHMIVSVVYLYDDLSNNSISEESSMTL